MGGRTVAAGLAVAHDLLRASDASIGVCGNRGALALVAFWTAFRALVLGITLATGGEVSLALAAIFVSNLPEAAGGGANADTRRACGGCAAWRSWPALRMGHPAGVRRPDVAPAALKCAINGFAAERYLDVVDSIS